MTNAAHLDAVISAARDASARLAAIPKVRSLAQSDENTRIGALRHSLRQQERAAWLVAAISRAGAEKDDDAVRMLEHTATHKGYLNATVFNTDSLRRIAEDGDMELVGIVYRQHFTA